MDIYVLPALVVLLIIVMVVINVAVVKPRQRRKLYADWQLRERTKWLTKFNAAKTKGSLGKGYLDTPDKRWANDETKEAVKEFEHACKQERMTQKIECERQLAEEALEAKSFYETLRQISDPRARWKLLLNAPPSTFSNTDDKTSLNDYKKQGIEEYTTLLLDEARSGNAQSFFNLVGFTHGKERGYDQYSDVTKRKYDFPKDWDQLLTKFYKNPSVNLFKNQPDYDPSRILLLATEALRIQDFVVAKLVLAYSMESRVHEVRRNDGRSSQKYWPYRAAIGDILLTNLAAMVDSVHVTRGLFQKAATPVIE